MTRKRKSKRGGKRPGAGRKPLGPGRGTDGRMVALRLTEHEYVRLVCYADGRGESLSTVLRARLADVIGSPPASE